LTPCRVGATQRFAHRATRSSANHDPETGGQLTVKLHESTKVTSPDDSWRHGSIVLRPDSTLPGYEPIILTGDQADDLRIIAELVAVLG
jgi:uncharacterized protein